MTTLTARTIHITSNGLGNDPTARPTPDFLQQAMIRRGVIVNTIRFFEEDGDLVAASASRLALAELDATIARPEWWAAIEPIQF